MIDLGQSDNYIESVENVRAMNAWLSWSLVNEEQYKTIERLKKLVAELQGKMQIS